MGVTILFIFIFVFMYVAGSVITQHTKLITHGTLVCLTYLSPNLWRPLDEESA